MLVNWRVEGLIAKLVTATPDPGPIEKVTVVFGATGFSAKSVRPDMESVMGVPRGNAPLLDRVTCVPVASNIAFVMVMFPGEKK